MPRRSNTCAFAPSPYSRLHRSQVELCAPGELNEKPTLLLQVSLAVVGDDQKELADLDRIAADFCDKAGLRPLAVHQIAGAFRFTQYDFFKSWAMRYIAAKMEQDVDPHADREYTDWAKLADIVKDFASVKDPSANAKARGTVRPTTCVSGRQYHWCPLCRV